MFPQLSHIFQPGPPNDFKPFAPESPIEDDDDVFYGLGVGLSDQHISQKRQNMLNLADRLRSVGAQADIDIPQIAVIGTQSSGKSSLLHSISGVGFARDKGTCTRVPTEILLKQAPGPWQCVVSLRKRRDTEGNLLGQPINESFGPVIEEGIEVEGRLKRAQLAILNPSRPAEEFLHGPPIEKSELSFSDNCVSVLIQGPKESNLSLCDLPGIIASVSKRGNDTDIAMIENLIESYIEKPNCLILLTATCEADFETQGAYRMAVTHDPEGKRTLGVLTKPDRIASGNEENWIRFVKNEVEPLDLGWFCVKQPDYNELKRRITWQEARDNEDKFFKNTMPWCSPQNASIVPRLGIQPLVERLSERLSDLIARRLPKLQHDVEEMLRVTENCLRDLPAPPSEDCLAEAMNLVAQFANDMERLISGSTVKGGPRLVQNINLSQNELKKEILSLAPRFNPYKSNSKHIRLPEIEFLEKEEGGIKRKGKAMHIDEVMDLIESARTRELPGYIPFNVPATILNGTIDEWHKLAMHFLEEVYKSIGESAKCLMDLYFKRFEYGGMLDTVRSEIQNLLERLGEETRSDIDRFLARERTPFTLNGHYLARYKDDFLAYFKGCRQMEVNSIAMHHIVEHARLSTSDVANLSLMRNDAVTQVLAGLNTMNIRDVKASDLPKLLPRDPYEPALELMATVSAYYQVSSKRFIDNVSLAVDFLFVRSFAGGIQKTLYNQIIKGDPEEKCAKFLRESPAMRERRNELQSRLDRLKAAKAEMMSYSIW